MPRGRYSDLVSNEQAKIDGDLLPTLIKDMAHGQTGYFYREGYGVNLRDRSKRKRLWINGLEDMLTAQEAKEAHDNGARLAQVTFIHGKNLRGTPVQGYIIDDSFCGQSDHGIQVERLDFRLTTMMPLKVIRWACEEVGAGRVRQALIDQFALDIGQNALFNYSDQAS